MICSNCQTNTELNSIAGWRQGLHFCDMRCKDDYSIKIQRYLDLIKQVEMAGELPRR